MATAMLIHHATNRGKPYHSCSLSGLRHCIEAGASVVEMDIVPLRGGDFALLHDQNLGKGTEGEGFVSAVTAADVQLLHCKHKGVVLDDTVGLLTQAISLVRGKGHLQELQLDLKPEAILNEVVLKNLIEIIEPTKGKIRVSSAADWALRRLHALDPDLPLGFDPFLYLDVKGVKGRGRRTPPFQVGTYGFWDDHPLASRLWGSPADYLESRAEALWSQVPIGMWYLRASLLEQVLHAGFDWIEYLHDRGAVVVAWTLNPDSAKAVELARRLLAAGVDRITTNDAPRLAKKIGMPVAF